MKKLDGEKANLEISFTLNQVRNSSHRNSLAPNSFVR